MTLYFDAGGALVEDPAKEGAVPLSWSHPQWVQGDPPKSWLGPGGLAIFEASATLVFRATDLATTTLIRDDLTIWWGSQDSTIAHASAAGPMGYQPGDRVTVTMDLEIPRNGLWFGPEEMMRAQVATYTTDGPNLDRMELLVGGPDGSRIQMAAQDIAHGAFEEDATNETERWTGTHGGDCVNGATQFIEHTIDAALVRSLHLTGSGTGVQDLDVYVLQDGERIMRSHDPGLTEVLRLREANLDGIEGDLTLQVLGLCAAQIDYTLVAFA